MTILLWWLGVSRGLMFLSFLADVLFYFQFSTPKEKAETDLMKDFVKMLVLGVPGVLELQVVAVVLLLISGAINSERNK